MPEHGMVGKVPVPQAEECAGKQTRRVQHSIALLPPTSQLPFAAQRGQELGPLLGMP